MLALDRIALRPDPGQSITDVNGLVDRPWNGLLAISFSILLTPLIAIALVAVWGLVLSSIAATVRGRKAIRSKALRFQSIVSSYSPPPSTYSYSDDAGTAITCQNPQRLSAVYPLRVPPVVDATYATSDNLRWSPGTQSIHDVQPFGGTVADAFSTRARLVWRPDYQGSAQGFVVSNAGDDSTIPFLQLTAANPTGNLVGELYTGYLGSAASLGNRRASPLQVVIPVGTLAGQQASIPGSPPNAAPVLTSVMAVPSNKVFTDPTQTAMRCYATGFYADSLGQPLLFKDHSATNANATVVWSVTSTSGLAHFSTAVPNVLLLDPAQGAEQITITVTVTANGVTKTDRQACWTNF